MIGVSGTASAIARKCAYKPSCVGLLYQGATCSSASAPASRARLEYSIADAVELLPAPAITFARPRATSIVNPITRASSSSVIVALSPVVPQGTSKRTPPSICRSTRARMRSSSIAPSDLNGVTKAVAHPRIQSSFIVISSSSLNRHRDSEAQRSKKLHLNLLSFSLRLCASVADDLIEHFGKLIDAFAAHNPLRGEQCAGCKAFPRSRFMRDCDLIGD